MHMKNNFPLFRILLIVSVIVPVLFGCKKNIPEGDQTAQKTGNALQPDMVLTPFGYQQASHVHYLPPHHNLISKDDKVLEVDSKTGQVYHTFTGFNKPSDPNVRYDGPLTALRKRSATSNIAPYGSGWITDAFYTAGGTDLMNYFYTQWTVPPAPATYHTQTVFIFPALEDESANPYIIQPVLQYGPSSAGGGNYYSITNWYGYGTQSNGHYWYGTLYTVTPGTNLQGVIQLTGNGNTYGYTSSFNGNYPNSSVSFVDASPMMYAYEALEAYNIQSFEDYPTVLTYPNTNVQNPDVVMNNIQITNETGQNVAIEWGVQNIVADIQQHTTIVTQGSPGGQVDIFFTNPWTPPPAPEINGKSSFYFTSQVQSGGGTITAQSGQLVTVTVGASGPPPGNYSASCYLSGVTFTDGTTSISVSNGSTSKQFHMISSGSVSWTGNFSESNSEGSGYISVQ